jgi:hypothetical protein
MADVQADRPVGNFNATHLGVQHHITSLFPQINIQEFYICVLHFMLRVVAKMFGVLVGSKLYNEEQCKKVNVILHQLHVFIPPIQKQSKEAELRAMKSKSFGGKECERVVLHFPLFLAIAYPLADQRLDSIAIGEKFLQYYWTLLHRVGTAQLRQEKAVLLRKMGDEFVAAWEKATGNDALSPYIHAMVCAIPDQVERCAEDSELADLSGQGLENKNQQKKKTGSNRCDYSQATASDGGLNQNGKRGRDMVAQIACHDVQVNYMESKHGEHLTLYMRKRLRHGSRCTGPSEKFEVPELCYEI